MRRRQSNRDFRAFADQHDSLDAATEAFLALFADETADPEAAHLTSACKACVHPVPATADIAVEWFGTAPAMDLTARAGTENGQTILSALELSLAEMAPQARKTALDGLLKRHRQYRDEKNAVLADTVDSLPGLSTYLADCVNCYNCRVACPVCYCTTCVFTTDTFRHEPFQYLQWARRKGSVKMPTDTLFFHLTRMAHMSCACVGCGQCTNACPNEIPLSDLFAYVARHTQATFGYAAGMDIEARPPMSEFEAEEFQDVVGM
ncbi:hypothetical protein [Desulfosarcina cetonica]|uniref:hypothetical protein n=1 Tax=Desulfosarcina cetonica TaxID=90730 RepID=UPI0006CFD245|nr:hypothetical protein [Desulfosarcina cetonica]